MLRYLRLYAHLVRFSFSKALAFRMDFFFRFVMDLVYYAVHLAFFGVLYRHTALLGGWTLEKSLVFLGAYFVIDAMNMTVFASNLWNFPFLVNKGDLDFYLVRPASPLFFASLREFAANSFLNLLVAGGILAFALARLPGAVGSGRTAVFLLSLPVGTLLVWSLHMLFLIPVFWLHSNEGLNQVFFSVEHFAERPDGIYTGWTRRILVSVLPFAVTASFPARILFEGPRPGLLLHLAAVASGAFLAMLWLWRRGLRAYTSASS